MKGTVDAEASVRKNCTKKTLRSTLGRPKERHGGLIIGMDGVLQTVGQDKSC